MLMQSWNWKSISFYAAETTYLLAHPLWMNNISNASLNSAYFIRVILYGDKNFDNAINFKMIAATIKFIKTMKRFEEALF